MRFKVTKKKKKRVTFRSGNSLLLDAKKFFKIGIGERGGELTY
jgi:hypothetical protein